MENVGPQIEDIQPPLLHLRYVYIVSVLACIPNVRLGSFVVTKVYQLGDILGATDGGRVRKELHCLTWENN